MKTIITLAVIVFTVSQISFAETQKHTVTTGFNKEKQAEQNLQDRIMDSFMGSFETQDNSKLNSIIDEITLMYDQSQNSLFLYWKGYALYYNSIFYLKNGDKETAEKELSKAIESLESIDVKNSEDYALLSMLYNFSCQFIGFPKIIQVSKKATDCIEKAKKLNPDNLRAYYVEANNNYYTPQEYGGGKMVEECLIKAISLPTQKISNPYLPSWGRQESFEMLTDYYIKTNNVEQARKYIEQGLSEYPDSYTLLKNKSKLN